MILTGKTIGILVAAWVDEPAFREGNLVWGRLVADIPEYCRELQAISKKEFWFQIAAEAKF